MRSFFKTFFASLLALFIFCVLFVLIIIGLIAGATSGSEKPDIGTKAVLVLDLSKVFKEQALDNPFSMLSNSDETETPGLYDVIRLIKHAKSDSAIKGIYLLCSSNPNGYAASEEIRKAIIDFKRSQKFVIAYGETITQKGYYIGSAANMVYCHPQGGLEWDGFSSNMIYLKGYSTNLKFNHKYFMPVNLRVLRSLCAKRK